MTIILGVLRIIGLKALSLIFGAWLSPTIKAAIGSVLALGLAVTIYAFWPSSGNPIGDAVLDALGQRDAATKINIDEEKRDNAWIEEYQKWMDEERAAVAKTAGNAVDRVIWRADDPWLRAKRSAKGG